MFEVKDLIPPPSRQSLSSRATSRPITSTSSRPQTSSRPLPTSRPPTTSRPVIPSRPNIASGRASARPTTSGSLTARSALRSSGSDVPAKTNNKDANSDWWQASILDKVPEETSAPDAKTGSVTARSRLGVDTPMSEVIVTDPFCN